MTTQTGDPKNVAAVREVFDRWLAAIRSRNLDGVVSAHDAGLVMFDVPDPPMLRGLDAYRDAWEGFLEWFGAKGVFDPSELTIVAGEDVAFTHCLIRCIGSTPSEVEKPVRLTIGYHKVGGEWLIAHEHHSVGWDIEG